MADIALVHARPKGRPRPISPAVEAPRSSDKGSTSKQSSPSSKAPARRHDIDWHAITAAYMAGTSLTNLWVRHCRTAEKPLAYYSFTRHLARSQQSPKQHGRCFRRG